MAAEIRANKNIKMELKFEIQIITVLSKFIKNSILNTIIFYFNFIFVVNYFCYVGVEYVNQFKTLPGLVVHNTIIEI